MSLKTRYNQLWRNYFKRDLWSVQTQAEVTRQLCINIPFMGRDAAQGRLS